MLVLVEKMGVEEHPTMEICMHKVEQAHALMAVSYTHLNTVAIRFKDGKRSLLEIDEAKYKRLIQNFF